MEEFKRDPYVLADGGKSYMRHFSACNKELIDIKGPKNYFKAMLSTLLISQKHVMVQVRMVVCVFLEHALIVWVC